MKFLLQRYILPIFRLPSYYFKSGQHVEVERQLFDRISINYVTLFAGIPGNNASNSAKGRKDFFFQHFSDAIAQAVLYCMLLAYPKSRVHFTEKFRHDLIVRISFWFTGIKPQVFSCGICCAFFWKRELAILVIFSATK